MKGPSLFIRAKVPGGRLAGPVLFCLLLLPFWGAGCLQKERPSPPYEALRTKNVHWGRRGMVVTVDDIAASVGLGILKGGGNAVDAAVATAFALAVTHPAAGNLGGGGFMLIHLAGQGREVALDFREVAPGGSSPRMYLDAGGKLQEGRANRGFLSVGVPGTVAGMALAWEKFGTMDWRDLMEPAISLAREGFWVDANLASDLKAAAKELRKNPSAARIFMNSRGAPLTVGERLIQKDLGWSLEQLAKEGSKAFYEGSIGERIVADMKRRGGIITLEDMKNYQAKIRQPSSTVYRGFRVVTIPLPSSGGVTLVEMLNILENFPLAEMGFPEVKTMHVIAEAMKRAFCDRACFLGDPDFVEVPVERLTSKEYGKEAASQISLERATSSRLLAEGKVAVEEGKETTHFSIVDGERNMVSCTYTLNDSFGAHVVAEGTGILLNNEMADFNVIPHRTDEKGAIGTPANRIAAGKRMLSSMSPTTVFKEERPYAVLGSPGGKTIINTILLVLVHLIDFQRDLPSAIREGRFHHQWFPDTLQIEKGIFPEEILKGLRELGHEVKEVASQGDLHAIRIYEDGALQGVADHRIDGCAAGY